MLKSKKTKASRAGKMAPRPASSSQKNNKAPKTPNQEERVATLEKGFKAVHKKLKQNRAELEEVRKELIKITSIVSDGFYTDREWREEIHKDLKIKDRQIYALHEKVADIYDKASPERRSPVRSPHGKLVDQGGASPVDGNAAKIFKPPIP